MTFDWTISVSDVLLFGGGVFAFVRVFMTVRDSLRDLSTAVGHAEPPSGLIGDVRAIQAEQQQQREWLIRGGLDNGR